MSVELERGLGVLECLARSSAGLTFTEVSETLDLPKGAAHRLLAELRRLEFISFDELSNRYALTLKPVSMALQYLSFIPVVELTKPILERIANESGELVRLNLLDGNRLVRVAKAQGSVAGLRYDPDHGGTVKLAAASAYAWLSTLPIDEALAVLAEDGWAAPGEYGPAAPRTAADSQRILEQAARDGYCYLTDTFEDGISTLAYPIRSASGLTIGVFTIAGPTFRFTREVALRHLDAVRAAADDIALLPTAELLGSLTVQPSSAAQSELSA